MKIKIVPLVVEAQLLKTVNLSTAYLDCLIYGVKIAWTDSQIGNSYIVNEQPGRNWLNGQRNWQKLIG